MIEQTFNCGAGYSIMIWRRGMMCCAVPIDRGPLENGLRCTEEVRCVRARLRFCGAPRKEGGLVKYPNIELERRLKGFTRGGLAGLMNIPRELYFAWVDGERLIPSNFVTFLCDLFRCSREFLLAPDQRGARWRRFHRLDDSEREMLLPGTV